MNHDPFETLLTDKGLEPIGDEKRKKPEQIRLRERLEGEEMGDPLCCRERRRLLASFTGTADGTVR